MNHTPLVIIGMDAGDDGLIRRWAEEGYLPNLAALMKKGCWGRTVGGDLISEHGIWVSLFSGLHRGQHGYYDFRQLKSGTYDLQYVTARDARAVQFWHYLRGKNKSVGILDSVPDALPVPDLPGIQVENWATHQPNFGPVAQPSELLQEVQRIFGPQLKVEIEWNSDFTTDKRIYAALMDRVKKKGELGRALLTRDRHDLIVTLFTETHTAGHQFWKYHSRIGGELKHAIREVYQATDREIGLLLAKLPADSNVFVVTSAGMEDHWPTSGLLESFCRKLGFQATPEPGGFSLHPMALMRRLIPESLRVAVSRHFSDATRERLLADQFRNSTDWQRTRAFSIPSFYAGSLRLNLKGREPQGQVDSTAYEEVIQKVRSELLRVTDPQTGEPAIDKVPSTYDLFGVRQSADLPDLFVEWRPHDHYLEHVKHPQGDLSQKPDFLRDSGHSHVGFFIAAGPGIHGQGNAGDVPVLDLAPTFLTVLGEPVPKVMSGTPAKNVL